jgi:glycine hydroxymethyltransferase
MCDVIDARGERAAIDAVKEKVLELCARFPVYAR